MNLTLQVPEDRIHEKLQRLQINDSPDIPKDDPKPMSSLKYMVKTATVGMFFLNSLELLGAHGDMGGEGY